ncbi:relaxase/mobilization nuclease domain-containing protein [Corynebacterium sp. MSK122]|uniref:relaxase/mobilization nuclease domain-containing protein n=1 Tax=Corynebacterium sp. MSK122 TaxID=3050206 RepID=UPI003AF08D82
MSVSKVQRSKSAVASTIYAVWGTRKAKKAGEVRASALSVVGPRGYHPLAWALEVQERVASSAQRRNETINIIQSFSPEELDPVKPRDVERAHSAGLALAEKVAPGCDVLVATHTDTAHVHNHILIANHDRQTGYAAPKGAGNAWHVREVNDEVMKSYGLVVLEQHEVSYSHDERMAKAKGLDIDGSELSLDELTRENWREFARARIEDLLEDDRVVEALDADGEEGINSAFDVMEDIAPEYHLSFSRKGRGKRKRERSSFAVVDDNDDVLRVTGANGKGNARAASAGSRLGADFTLNGLRAQLLLMQAKENVREIGEFDYADEYASEEESGYWREFGAGESTGSGGEEPSADCGGASQGRGSRVQAAGEKRPGREEALQFRWGVEELPYGIPSREPRADLGGYADLVDQLGRATEGLKEYNRRNGGIQRGSETDRGRDDEGRGSSGPTAGGDSKSETVSDERGGGYRRVPGVSGNSSPGRPRSKRGANESKRQRSREADRLHREASEADGGSEAGNDHEPEF